MKPKYVQPTEAFKFSIRHRLNILAVSRRVYEQQPGAMPRLTPLGIRQSALKGKATDRILEVSYPYVRHIVNLRREHRNEFPAERMERIGRLLEMSNATCYSKLYNCQIDLKKTVPDKNKKRSWTENDWKKHMDIIGPLAAPRPACEPPPVDRGPNVSLDQLLPRIEEISTLPEHKIYRPLAEQPFYRDPTKVSRSALKYKLSERMKELATPKALKTSD